MHIQCVYIVKVKYQTAPSKAVVGVDKACQGLHIDVHAISDISDTLVHTMLT